MPKETFFRLRDEKQERILRAAIHEFAENGFERAKVEDIADSAKVAKGSIYQYFEDKKELFIYCARWGIDVFMKKISGHRGNDEVDIFAYFIESASQNKVLIEERELAIFLQVVMAEPGFAHESIKNMYDAGDKYIKTLLLNSRKKGVVRTDIDEELVMEYFIAVTERFEKRLMSRYIDFTKEMSEETIRSVQYELENMLELLKNGMGC